MADMNYIDKFYDKVIRGLPDDEVDALADERSRSPAPAALQNNSSYATKSAAPTPAPSAPDGYEDIKPVSFDNDEPVSSAPIALPSGKGNTKATDYNGKIEALLAKNDSLESPKRDMLSQVILSLGPAVLGGLSGESGALAAPKAQAGAQAAYDKDLAERQAEVGSQRKNISDNVKSLLAQKKIDAQEKQATSRDAMRAQQAQVSTSLGQERLKESKERGVTTDWNRAAKDQVSRIEAGNRVLGLVGAIRDGALVDSSNIRNTLTNDLSILALPSGSSGALADREKTAIKNLYTMQKDLVSFVTSNPNKSIPPEYLDQIENEAKILQNKYGSALKGRYSSMLGGTSDPYKKDLYKGRYESFMTENHMDPSSGSYKGAQTDEKTIPPDTRQKMIDDLKAKGYK